MILKIDVNEYYNLNVIHYLPYDWNGLHKYGTICGHNVIYF